MSGALHALLEALADREDALEELDAQGLMLDENCAAELCRGLRVLGRDVRVLRLGPADLTADGAASVARALRQGVDAMEELALDGWNVSADDVADIVSAISEGAPRLRSLGLTSADLGSAAAWTALANLLSHERAGGGPPLAELRLDGSRAAELAGSDGGENAAAAFGRALAARGAAKRPLDVLSMGRVSLSGAALAGLVRGLDPEAERPDGVAAAGGGAVRVSLAGSLPLLPESSAAAWFAAAAKLARLAAGELDLRDNGLDVGVGAGAQLLANQAAGSSGPRRLDLRGNAASSAAFASLSSLCASSERLEELLVPDQLPEGGRVDELVSLLASGVQQSRDLRRLSFGRLLGADGILSTYHRDLLLSAVLGAGQPALGWLDADVDACRPSSPAAILEQESREADIVENTLAARLVLHRMVFLSS